MILKNYSAFFFSFWLLVFGFLNSPIFAQDMNSQNFSIQGGNFNVTSGNKSSQNFNLTDVVGQTAAGVFSSKGYIIQAGFLNSAAAEVFSFSVSPAVVDFGDLIPNTPVEKPVKISISNGGSPGYTVTVSENQPLSTSAGAEIPDTLCDPDATKPCSYDTASKWTSNATYGFGYRLDGITTPDDFLQVGYYRPFPASRRNNTPVVIMQSGAKNVTDQANMTLRVNVSTNQPVGQYRNVLSFTALAGM